MVTFVPVLWLFSREPDLRRKAILVALGCTLVCLLLLAARQRRAGGWQPFSEVVAAELSETVQANWSSATDSADLPRVLPSRRRQQQRTLLWGVGVCTAIIGIVALAAGMPQRSELVQRLYDAGAEFSLVPVEKVSDVRQLSRSGKDPYVATVVVQLPDATKGESVHATVRAETYDRLNVGDRVEVLYAPSEPRLGAVAGDDRKLGTELRGEVMPAYLRWGCITLWILGVSVVLNAVSRKHGFRAFSRLSDRDKAVRGRYVRTGKYHHERAGGRGEPSNGKYLEIQTDAGWIHFLTDISDYGLPTEMEGQPLWLCWDARRGSQARRFSAERTPAALVFDSDWVIHGMLNVDGVKTLRNVGSSVEKLSSSVQRNHLLRLFDPRAKWPLSISPLFLGLCFVATVCAAVLTLDLDIMWRWVAGGVGVLSVVAGASPYVSLSPEMAKSGTQ
ncbi:hypothetical protein [Streptomyces sp. Y2F8-2]|uniref:hypothetical protein n=1 Tax=Streptomyces sp. Y2F8-2 TaxID=2759675 RepID=UPI00190580FE|nr:hypothetical protein [Streptomyces sp. Y2F8-2]